MYLGPAYGSWFWSFRQTGSSLRYVLSPPASFVQLYIFCCWGKRHYRREYTCSWFLSCNSTGNEIFTLAMNVLTVKRERRVITCPLVRTVENKSLNFVSTQLCPCPEGNSAGNLVGECILLPLSKAMAKRLLPAHCHMSGKGRINRCGPALPGMLLLHPALLLLPSLSSQGKGKRRKGRSSKPRPSAVTTETYKKLFMSHTHWCHICQASFS